MRSLTDSSRIATALARFLPIGVILLAWELVTRTGFVNPYVFPPVSEVLLRWLTMIINGSGFVEGAKVFLNGEQEKHRSCRRLK